MYVFLWPIISLTSSKPPTLILTNFLFKALAIDLAIVVFPTPGGPTKQIIDWSLSHISLVAIYSIILSFISFNP